MKQVVFDTNVSVAAFFWNGNLRKIFDLAKQHKIKLFYSIPILNELIRVLAYEKFGLSKEQMLPLVIDFMRTATVVTVASKINAVDKDPTDNIFLECAVDAKADYIISGDSHLLELKIFKEIKIVTPKKFLEEMTN